MGKLVYLEIVESLHETWNVIENLRSSVGVQLFRPHSDCWRRAIESAVCMDSPIPVFWFDLAHLSTNHGDDCAVFAVHRL